MGGGVGRETGKERGLGGDVESAMTSLRQEEGGLGGGVESASLREEGGIGSSVESAATAATSGKRGPGSAGRLCVEGVEGERGRRCIGGWGAESTWAPFLFFFGP